MLLGTITDDASTPSNLGAGMSPDMELSLPARAENIALIRHALGALGETLTVEEQLLADMRLAITEACSNVVVHAYANREPGPLQIDATLHEDDRLTVVVRDEGPGIVPHPGSPGLGLGLPLIASLSESVELGRDAQDRTEVRMTFSLADAPRSDAARRHSDIEGSELHREPDEPGALLMDDGEDQIDRAPRA
jgi:anti-sigma regulatory factor (Ser/Thr protein kinase)